MKPEITRASRPFTFEVDALNERGEVLATPIAGEHPLTLYVDKREIVTLMTMGQAPEALAIGYLRNQRLVRSIDEIAAVQVDWETRLGRGGDAPGPREPRREDGQAHRHHRLRPGHGVR